MDPLPFRLPAPGLDDVSGTAVVSVTVKVEGLAHWTGEVLVLEWAETHHVDEVSLQKVRSDVVVHPSLTVDVPPAVLASVEVTGGWWRPRLELRGRYLDLFVNIPGSRPGRLPLRIARRDRDLARQLAAELNHAIERAAALPPEQATGALEPSSSQPDLQAVDYPDPTTPNPAG